MTTTSPITEILRQRPLLVDVRAPVEFAKGHLPGSVNLPLMNDAERDAVGKCYQQQGQQAAIARGHALVHGHVKQQRVDSWLAALQQPRSQIICARGGLRSQISQQWCAEAGTAVPRVAGGYRAIRQYLFEWLEQNASRLRIVMIAGRTGCGKTQLIEAEPQALDLEGLAHHRGSGFGAHIHAQPAQATFENTLLWRLWQLAQFRQTILIEDEGPMVGSRHLPKPLHDAMQAAPIIRVREPLALRTERVLAEYVVSAQQDYETAFLSQGIGRFREQLRHSLFRIRKRLGGARYAQCRAWMEQGFYEQEHQWQPTGHRAWIAHLLQDYYDPMYDYQQNQKDRAVLFSGGLPDCQHAWWQILTQSPT